jgi:hypothetical protein
MIQRTTVYKSKVVDNKQDQGRKHPLDAIKKRQMVMKGGSVQDLSTQNKSRIRPEVKTVSAKISSKNIPQHINKLVLENPISSTIGILTHEKLKTKTQEGFGESMKSRGQTKFREEDEIGSDVEVKTERPHLNPPVTGSQTYRAKYDVHSNIDGFSQSDIFEQESKGYLNNSRFLLSRLKRNNTSMEYGTLHLFYYL